MAHHQVDSKNSPGNRKRKGKREREADLKKQVKRLQLRLAVLETTYQLEIVRRQNIVEEILTISSLEELKTLRKSLKSKPHMTLSISN